MNLEQNESKDSTKLFGFSINSSNQANLLAVKDLSLTQVNSIFILVAPFTIEKFSIDGLDIDISIDEKGKIYISGEQYQSIEIKPGIRIFGVNCTYN